MPGSCICSGLPVANCLRQLCPLGTRSLSAQASVCGSPFGAVLDLGSLRSPIWGKSPLLPILTAGLAMSRAAELASLRLPSCTLGARLFPPSKWAGLFPSAAYRRSAPPQLAAGKRTPCRLRCFVVAGRFCGVDKWADVLFPQPAVGIRSPCRLGCFGAAYSFLQRKRPAWFQSHAGLFKRVMRPVAEWRSLLIKWQGAAPDRRAARPVAERR